jgi:hypothetical protein
MLCSFWRSRIKRVRLAWGHRLCTHCMLPRMNIGCASLPEDTNQEFAQRAVNPSRRPQSIIPALPIVGVHVCGRFETPDKQISLVGCACQRQGLLFWTSSKLCRHMLLRL